MVVDKKTNRVRELIFSFNMGLSEDNINDFCFHLKDSMVDLIDFIELSKGILSGSVKNGRRNKKIFSNIIYHASNHIIAAHYILTKRVVKDRFNMDIWRDAPEIEYDAMYKPCLVQSCDTTSCVCRLYGPIKVDCLNDYERAVYEYLFNGDASIEEVKKTANLLIQCIPYIDRFVRFFLEEDRLDIIQFENFFEEVPDRFGAVYKLVTGEKIEDFFMLGFI